MRAKVVALGLLVGGMLGAQQALGWVISLPEVSQAAADRVVLVPETLRDYPIEKRWTHALNGTTVEDGALYSPVSGSGTPIQLDFYRNSFGPHEGSGCYLAQGERLLRRSRMILPTRGRATALFMISTMTDGRDLRLAASTECYADRCEEAETRTDWQGLLSLAFFDPDRRGVVPISLVLRRPYDDHDDLVAIESDMLAEVKLAIGELDLAPARRHAAILDGH